MEYLTVKETSELWNMDISRIGKLLRAGKIEGAAKIGGHWVIPKGLAKPTDGRTRDAKAELREASFRFPFYVNFAENSFIPPLSNEEALLRKAQVCFFECNFEEAHKMLSSLLDNAKNNIVIISALFFECLISMTYYSGKNFDSYYTKMNLMLSDDFPHKADIELFRPWLYSFLGDNNAVSEKLKRTPGYEYDYSVCPLLSFLSFYQTTQGYDTADNSSLGAFEMICRHLEHEGYFYEAHELHFVLFMNYYIGGYEKAMYYHLKKALKIAEKNNYILLAASYEAYYLGEFERALRACSTEFAEKVKKYADGIADSFAEFKKNHNDAALHNTLSTQDSKLLLLAAKGYTYKKIASVLHISERTVANRYADICEKLGVENKQGLIRLLGDENMI